MSHMKAFHGFLPHFIENVALYQEMYDSLVPQDFKFPTEWDKKLNSFQKMIVLRCIRPDKVIPAIFKYIIE